MEYVIENTKTTSGTREIPMSDEVYACFQRIIENRKKVKTEPMIDGKCGFLYLDKNDYAIFNSSDLKNWVMTQKLTIPGAWECPDFREIPVEGGGKKWIFWSADGYYFLILMVPIL